MYRLGTEKLLNYINRNGIIACNKNRFLTSIFDINCTWEDVIDLIDTHEIFYSKIYRKRTVYLSKILYSNLKNIYIPKQLSNNARSLYEVFEHNPPLSMPLLKQIACYPKKELAIAFNELVESLYITAISVDRNINSSWSSFCYGTSKYWESYSKTKLNETDIQSVEYVKHILSSSIPEKDVNKYFICP